MKPSEQARHAASVTLSKGKMYEYKIPDEYHLAIPEGLHLEDQFPLAVGTIGDAAAEVVVAALSNGAGGDEVEVEDLTFAARVLQAFVHSRQNLEVTADLLLLSASGHYLASRPGDSVS